MGLYLNHVNTVLQKMRQPAVTALSTDASSVTYRAQEAVQRAVTRVWNARQWTFKRRASVFATVANQADYLFPKDVGEPYSITLSDYPWRLRYISKAIFDQKVPNPVDTGNPRLLIPGNMQGVQVQPASALVVSAVSSAASDTTQTVVVRGLVGEEEDYETLALVGTSAVTGIKTFTSIISVTKSAATVGRITVSANSVTLVTLSPLDLTTVFRVATLYPTPTSVLTVTVNHYRQSTILVTAYDDTLIPAPRWDYVIDQWAFAFALQSQGQDQLEEANATFTLAQAFIDDDMALVEEISSEEVLNPLRWGDAGGGEWFGLPSGYGLTE